jgi:hypothetical protein
MRDIVKRLRAWSPLISSGLEVPAAALVIDKAAAEIERLRALLDTADEIARQRAERRERIATACLVELVAWRGVAGNANDLSDAAIKFADALIARLDKEAQP